MAQFEGDALAHWLNERCGKFTGSRMPDALDFRKDGKPGAKRVALIKEILAERLTGDAVRHYVTPAMEWGLLYEDPAKAAYEARSGEFIAKCGFYDHPEIDMFGATPDGLVGSDGLVEIKCPTTVTHLDWIMERGVPEQHKPQMLAQLACTRRKWVDFVSYDPRVREPRLQLLVARFTPKPEEIAAIEEVAVKLLAEVDAAWEALHS